MGIRGLQQYLNRQQKGGQDTASTIEDSLTSALAEVANTTNQYTFLVVDAKNYFYSTYLRLSRQFYPQILTSRIWPYHRRAVLTHDTAIEKIEQAFKVEVRKHIEHFARASDRYVLVWDRTGADTLARQEEARARAVARAREEQRYQQAETVILDYLNTRPPFEASEAALRRRPRCYPKKLRVPKRVLCALSQTRKSAWAMVPFPNRLFLSSSFQEPALPPRDSYDGDSLSPALQQALGLWLPHQVLHVEARNEADNTISRIARGSYNDYAIVILSTDTDYLVRDSVQHVGWTLSKLGQGRRWRLTDRSKLQAIAPALFQDLDRARMAALIAGQDYTSVGIKGVSWTALADLADCLSSDPAETIEALRSQSSNTRIHRLLDDSPDFLARAVEGMAVWRTCQHLPPPTLPGTAQELQVDNPPAQAPAPSATHNHSGLVFPFAYVERQVPKARPAEPPAPVNMRIRKRKRASRQVFRFSQRPATSSEPWDPALPEVPRRPEDSTKDNRPEDPNGPAPSTLGKRRRTSQRSQSAGPSTTASTINPTFAASAEGADLAEEEEQEEQDEEGEDPAAEAIAHLQELADQVQEEEGDQAPATTSSSSRQGKKKKEIKLPDTFLLAGSVYPYRVQKHRLDAIIRRNPFPAADGDTLFSRSTADLLRLEVMCEKLARPTLNAAIELYFNRAHRDATHAHYFLHRLLSPDRDVFEGLVTALCYQDARKTAPQMTPAHRQALITDIRGKPVNQHFMPGWDATMDMVNPHLLRIAQSSTHTDFLQARVAWDVLRRQGFPPLPKRGAEERRSLAKDIRAKYKLSVITGAENWLRNLDRIVPLPALSMSEAATTALVKVRYDTLVNLPTQYARDTEVLPAVEAAWAEAQGEPPTEVEQRALVDLAQRVVFQREAIRSKLHHFFQIPFTEEEEAAFAAIEDQIPAGGVQTHEALQALLDQMPPPVALDAEVEVVPADPADDEMSVDPQEEEEQSSQASEESVPEDIEIQNLCLAHFLLTDDVPFLHHLAPYLHSTIREGRGLSHSYDPDYIDISTERTVELLLTHDALDVRIEWLNSFIMPRLGTATGAMPSSVPTDHFGDLDRLICLKHVNYARGNRSVASYVGTATATSAPFVLEACPTFKRWQSRLRTEWRDLLGITATAFHGIWTELKGRALVFLDLFLDTRRLEKNTLPTLFLKSDGYMVAITSFDPTRHWRNEAIPSTATARELFLQLSSSGRNNRRHHFYPAACDDLDFAAISTFLGDIRQLSYYPADDEDGPVDRLSRMRHPAVATNARLPMKDGLPISVRRLSAEKLEWIKEIHGLGSAEDLEDWIICGVDPGEAFSQTLHIRKPTGNGQWTTKSMTLSPHRFQSLIRQHQQQLARLRAKWLWQSSEVVGNGNLGDVFASILMRGATNYRHQAYQHELRTARVQDRGVKEIMEQLGFNPDVPNSQPQLKVLFAIGSSGSKRSGYRRGTAHFGNSTLAAVVKFARQRRYTNFVPVRVAEHWTSQACPTQSCRRMRGSGWASMPYNATTAIRSKLYKPLFEGSQTACQRLLQCEKCHVIRHRDVAGAENIGYVAWHYIVHGRHPWKAASA